MSRPITPCVLTDGLHDHEAFQAWRQVHRDDVTPGPIEILQRNKKAAVYRLAGLGPGGTALIAKRSRYVTGDVERIIYQQILPGIPVASLRCLGYVGDPSREFSWLFLEDARDERYSRLNPRHRALAGEWLGEMHLAVATGAAAALPDRSLGYYLRVLRDCRAGLELFAGAAPADAAHLLASFISFCEQIEGRWPGMKQACAVLPETLVHGDFATKNVRIRNNGTCDAILVFDWQFAGWGTAAVDLAQFIDRVVSPDLEAYHAVVARDRPHLGPQDIRRIAACGNILRLLDQLRWALSGLRVAEPKWAAKAAALLRAYEAMAAETLRHLEVELG